MNTIQFAETDLASALFDDPPCSNEIPSVIRWNVNSYADREMLTRMRYLARKRRMIQPDLTDEEMADYLALAENFKNVGDFLKARRRADIGNPLPTSITLLFVAPVTLAFLTAILIALIAVTV